MSGLVKLVKKFYEENSRYEAGPPIQLIKQLNFGKLALSDLELGDEDISVLIRLFGTKRACKEIKKIEINRSSGSKVSHRGTISAFSLNGYKLFREMLVFISKCEGLEMITFESIELSVSLMSLMGKALAASGSEIKWLAFKSCSFGGDDGLRALAPFLGKLQLQVLAFESCGLTDASLSYVSSIVKAQESNLDALYWNATLRLDMNSDNRQQLIDETDFVYSKGLVAISLCGNEIEGNNLNEFIRVTRKNNWLLGINLAHNKMSEASITEIVKQFVTNSVLQAFLLRGNDGFTIENAKSLYQSIAAKTIEDDKQGIPAAYTRLNKISPRVSWLLRSWMRLQCEETRDIIEQSLSQSMSRLSLNTTQRISREHNLRELFKPYSVFTYLHEDDEENLALRTSTNDNPLILYDLEEEDGQDGNGVLKYSTRNSLQNTEKFITEPFHPMNFEQAEFSKRYQQAQNEKKDVLDKAIPPTSPKLKGENDQNDWEYWPDEHNLHVSSQDERPPSRISIRPKRINGEFVPVIIPEAAAKKKKKKVPHYMLPRDAGTFGFESTNGLKLSDLATQSKSRPTSPAGVVRSSSYSQNNNPNNANNNNSYNYNYNANGNGAARVSQSAGRAPWRPSSKNTESPLRSRPKSPNAVSFSNYPERSQSAERFRDSHLQQQQVVASKQKKSSKKKSSAKKVSNNSSNNNNGAVYDELSFSVLKATKNLEQISKHLKTVAESLSESALLNLTNDHIQIQQLQQSRIENGTVNNQAAANNSTNHININIMDEDSRDNSFADRQPLPPQQLQQQQATASQSRYAPLTDQEQENLKKFTEEMDLANMVRERMQMKLKDVLLANFSLNH